MSLLSESVSTVLQAAAITPGTVFPSSIPQIVNVSVAVFNLEPPGLQLNQTVSIPLSVPIPKGAVVFTTVISTSQGFVSAGAATIGLGFIAPNDYEFGDPVNQAPYATNTFFVLNNVAEITASVNNILFTASDASITSGKTVFKILFVL